MNRLGKIVVLASVGFVAYKVFTAKKKITENSKGDPVLQPNQVLPTNTTSAYKPSPLQPEFFGGTNSVVQIPVTAPLSKKQQLTAWVAKRYTDLKAKIKMITIINNRLSGVEINTFYAYAITAGEDVTKMGTNTRLHWEALIVKHNIV